MLENLKPEEVSAWAKAIARELGMATPTFKNKEEAIAAFSAELTSIAQKRSLTVEKLLELAASSVENHDDFDRALRLSSLIYSFKNK